VPEVGEREWRWCHGRRRVRTRVNACLNCGEIAEGINRASINADKRTIVGGVNLATGLSD
jgi:hypothetical protein